MAEQQELIIPEKGNGKLQRCSHCGHVHSVYAIICTKCCRVHYWNCALAIFCISFILSLCCAVFWMLAFLSMLLVKTS
ncbi:MAG: hypothetical protein PHI85_02275 [Victivallaceae bacterium]|nr:hypothetical protein [Victivallaceae bacterium]